MSNQQPTNRARRNLLIATAGVGGVATAAAGATFLCSMQPSERAKAAGAPVEADISKLEIGQKMTVEWRGKPVWIIRRNKEMLESIPQLDSKVADPKSDEPLQPKYAQNELRSIKPDVLVVVGICSHLGCSPSDKLEAHDPSMGADWKGGFLCPCHGSQFDLAGRVFKGMPAPVNLAIPPHKYLSDTRILIGEDSKEA